MNNTFIKSILLLSFILILGLYLAPFKPTFEGFKGYKRYKSDELSVPGDFPRSIDKPILDDYPLINSKSVSTNNASDIWKDYPVFGVGSFEQLTNNMSTSPTFIFIDGSYFCFYRYHSLLTWWKNAYPEEIDVLQDPYKNEKFDRQCNSA